MSAEVNELPVLGARVDGSRTVFGAYVTTAATCAVRLYDERGQPLATHPMEADGTGHFSVALEGVGHGARYTFVVGENSLPDPWARFAPDGVHAPAMVVEARHRFVHPAPPVRPLAEQVIYELHVGCFTPEGTYASAARRLDDLVALGVTTVELLPVAAFPGGRGWGYDGVALYAPFAPYGTPDELRAFVDAAHGRGLSVLLDVVYNHFGPAGNYLSAYSGDFFGSGRQTPWGQGPSFEHPAMRRYLLENARTWLTEFRFDGLRLDAIHAIDDPSAEPLVRAITREAHALQPRRQIFAEDERNDPACLDVLGCDAVWADDFHHQVHVTLTGETDGYYAAYTPGLAGLVQVIERGWLYEGQVYPPWGTPRGKSAASVPLQALVTCLQNHDQIGNRAFGSRLHHDVAVEAFEAASALLLFLPTTPLLFMGQEWAASSPFQFFTDHDAELGPLVSAGRREEFSRFAAFNDPQVREKIPDPQDEATFQRSKLDWSERSREPHARVLEVTRRLLALRRSDPVLRSTDRAALQVQADGEVLVVKRRLGEQLRVLLANFGAEPVPLSRFPDVDGRTIVFGTRATAGPVLPPRAALIFS